MSSDKKALLRRTRRKATRSDRLRRKSALVASKRPPSTEDERYERDLARAIDTQVAAPPGLLWHYTSVESFRKILASDEMWATHYESAEDATDVVYAHDIVEIVVKDMLSTNTSRILAMFLMNYRTMKITELGDIYRLCFCAAEEDIGMWDRYAARGTGLAFGFDMKDTLQGIISKNAAFGLWPLKYDRGEQEAEIRKDFQAALDLAIRNRLTDARIAVSSLLRRCTNYCMYFKNQSYASEREWRLAITVMKRGQSPEVLTSTADGRSLRYVPLSDSQGRLFSLKRILIGPRSNMSVQDVEALLGQKGYGSSREVPVVTRSSIQLRK